MIYIIYGVSGVGKTSFGKALAQHYALPFYDADDFHPISNRQKMEKGTALEDQDRWPWLDRLEREFDGWENNGGAVLACSALKEEYRLRLLGQNLIPLQFILLHAKRAVLLKRLKSRTHFMPSSLLDSQLEILEKASYGIHIDANSTLKECLLELDLKLKRPCYAGLYGLGVMGKNLALNAAEKGISIAIYNRHLAGKEEQVAEKLAEENPDYPLYACTKLEDFIYQIQRPRKILLMVPAGKPLEQVIDQLIPLLDPGDILIDGGNSHFKSSIVQTDRLAKKFLHFYGVGVSGGAQGARMGPALMPSGNKAIYPLLTPLFDQLAAKDQEGKTCAHYLGPAGSGHFIKMVHNGIEYGEMQLLAELYHCLRFYGQREIEDIALLFENWNEGESSSYLLEITIQILRTYEDQTPLIDLILDQAGNKGTGKWTAQAAFDLGVPFETASTALQLRFYSAQKKQRLRAEGCYPSPKNTVFLEDRQLQGAYQAARILNHAFGFELIRQAGIEYQWSLALDKIAHSWTRGCIIRSTLMEEWSENLYEISDHPLFHSNWQQKLPSKISALIEIVQQLLIEQCPMPLHMASLNAFLNWKQGQCSANMIQAQRDFFGAHQFQRIDKEQQWFTHDW